MEFLVKVAMEHFKIVLLPILLPILFLFGIVLNVVVIISIIVKKEFANCSCFLSINLFICDLVMNLSAPLLTRNLLSDSLQNFLMYIKFVCLQSTFITFIVLAIEKFIAFTRKSNLICRNEKKCFCFSIYIITIWIGSFLMTFPALLYFANHLDCGKSCSSKVRLEFMVSHK